jgi:GT2 family glycosyltransferase
VAFQEVLTSIMRAAGGVREVIVVSDGSTDGSDRIAETMGARVIRLERSGGPSAARNTGAAAALSGVVLFLDADVSVTSDLIARVEAIFDGPGAPDAVFGSYDDAPADLGFFSQYRNLLHHFVHQTARSEATTFWTGCGAVRRDVFLALGGFDSSRRWLEDVEFGCRLSRAGGRIRLIKDLLVKHHKRWTFWGMLREDIARRAAPWTDLIWIYGRIPDDLNVRRSSRLAAALVLALPLLGAAALLLDGPPAWACAASGFACAAAQVWIDAGLYRFLARRRGVLFALRALPCHWLYYASAALTFAARMVWCILTRRPGGAATGVDGEALPWA